MTEYSLAYAGVPARLQTKQVKVLGIQGGPDVRSPEEAEAEAQAGLADFAWKADSARRRKRRQGGGPCRGRRRWTPKAEALHRSPAQRGRAAQGATAGGDGSGRGGHAVGGGRGRRYPGEPAAVETAGDRMALSASLSNHLYTLRALPEVGILTSTVCS